MLDLKRTENVPSHKLSKTPTGIQGLDEITGGGLPAGRPTLLAGSAGCGKTLLAIEFLVRGAVEFNEPGVFMSFEETSEEVTQNVSALGFDLADLEAKGLLAMEYVHVERSEIEETGEYDLQGLFIRLGYAIDSIGAKRVVLDTIETLFGGLSNQAILRSEVRRLFRWLKDKGVTAVITGERGDGSAVTRQGLEEFISDCVILLDHLTVNHISSRHMRIIKYRGSSHGTNEYPFLIGDTGISVLPITSLGLNHQVSNERISTGIKVLNEMLDGKGYYRGSSILVSGTAGTGKTSLASYLAQATCNRGEKCLFFTFEESVTQIVRNMSTIGLDLQPYIDSGLLKFHASRPALYGLETHLATIHKLVNEFKPSAVIIDPITNFISHSNSLEVHSMLMRLIDFLKMEKITAFFTSLTSNGDIEERSIANVTSLIDTWLLVRDIETSGERNRGIYVLKSRGMAHSNQVREFIVSKSGIELVEAYLGPEGVVTGSARVTRVAQEKAEAIRRQQDLERKTLNLERKRKALEVQIENLNAEFMADEIELQALQMQEETQLSQLTQDMQDMALSRGLEEFISDCVILLDHLTVNHISSRHMRIIKYRGSSHGTNEYPFLIGDTGISVLPITSLGLNHQVSNERISTGIKVLNEMLDGKGYYRGSSILVSGTAGTGKTSLASYLAQATCNRGEKCLFFTFEESVTQIVRNMSTIGLDLQPYIDSGLLKFHASRPALYGLETHLATIHKLVNEFKPSAVIIDPITNFISHSNSLEVHSMLMRLIDFLKMEKITAFFTSLTSNGDIEERSIANVTSLIDTWLLVRDIETSGERNRGIYVLKSRGMAHSNQVREFIVSKSGIELVEAYLGPEGVVTGSARVTRVAQEKAEAIRRQQDLERKTLNLERKRKALEVQIENLNAEFMADEIELQALQMQEETQLSQLTQDMQDMALSRGAVPTIKRNGTK